MKGKKPVLTGKEKLPLVLCANRKHVCLFNLNCRFSIPTFSEDYGINEIGLCGAKPKFRKAQGGVVIVIPLEL